MEAPDLECDGFEVGAVEGVLGRRGVRQVRDFGALGWCTSLRSLPSVKKADMVIYFCDSYFHYRQ